MSDNGGRRLINNRYVLLESLGSGGMGTVWRAEDQFLERSVAVKEVHVDSAGEHLAQRVRRAAREARTIARVAHPNVVNVYDLVHEDERLWIVMELVHGQSLARHLATTGAFSVPQAADIGRQLLEALKAVHAEGALHRDVKPANVLLRGDGRVVLCDFGIAWTAGGEPLTSSDALIGTADIMAPERLLDRPVGPPSDLYSLGVTLAWLVSGRSLFPQSEPAAVMYAVVHEDPDIPDSVGPLRPLIEALLRKDPAERPSAEAAASMLRALSAGEAAQDPPAGPPAQPPLVDAPPAQPPTVVAQPAVQTPPVPPPGSPPPLGRPRSRRWVLWTAPLAAAAVAGGVGAAAGLFDQHDEPDGKGADELPMPRRLSVADAMLQAPGNHRAYWMFRGDRCVLLRVTGTGGRPRLQQVGKAMPLRTWAPKLTAPFTDKVDAVMQAPGAENQFWLFSGNRYVAVRMTGSTKDPDVKPVAVPGPLSKWDPAFEDEPFRRGLDAVLPVWDKPNEYWVFSGDRFVRLKLKSKEEDYGVDYAITTQPLDHWNNLALENRVDAVLPVPGGRTDYWVLFGRQYVRVRIDESHDDELISGPHRLSTWRP